MLDRSSVWILPHSGPEISLFAFSLSWAQISPLSRAEDITWRGEGLETVQKCHVLESYARGIQVSIQAQATGRMLHGPGLPRPGEMGSCLNCCGNPLQRHTPVSPQPLAHRLGCTRCSYGSVKPSLLAACFFKSKSLK